MKIAESAVQLFSQHTALEKYQKHESLSVWGPGRKNVSKEVAGDNGHKINIKKELADFNKASNVEFSKQAMATRKAQETDEALPGKHQVMMNLNIRILKAMIERLTGKRIDDTGMPEEVQNNEGMELVEGPVSQPVTDETSGPGVPEGQSAGGFAYDYHESYYEYESTSFSGSGTILTEDGKEISFAVNLNMTREFYSENNLSIRAGDALKDPLVINFDGSAAELTQDKFSFDIDNDGHENQISFLTPGSGFLALDKNGDNIINNGSELFGPLSGNGFNDLAAYDSDGNNWIDENDSIFEKLRIWTKDTEGNDILFGLGEKGIGAIYLKSAATMFSMKDSENTLLGQLQSTGIFLGENGGAGTVQQVNLAV